jgi:hypothetical protein
MRLESESTFLGILEKFKSTADSLQLPVTTYQAFNGTIEQKAKIS